MNQFDFNLPTKVKEILPHSVQQKLWFALVDQKTNSIIERNVQYYERERLTAGQFLHGVLDWSDSPQGWD